MFSLFNGILNLLSFRLKRALLKFRKTINQRSFVRDFSFIWLLLFFVHSSFLLVIIIQIAVLAFTFGIHKPISVGASISITVSSILVIAVITHALSVMLLVLVRAFHDLHCLTGRLILDCLIEGIVVSVVTV